MILIRLLSKEEHRFADELVCAGMRKKYHCEAYPLPEVVLGGFQGNNLVGVIALSPAAKDKFSLREVYSLDLNSVPFPFDWEQCLQIGRLVSTSHNLAEALIYRSFCYGIGKGYRWGVGEMKPSVFRRFSMLGLSLVEITGKPRLENIPLGTLSYYINPPAPLPFAVDLIGGLRSLDVRVDMLLRCGLISFGNKSAPL